MKILVLFSTLIAIAAAITSLFGEKLSRTNKLLKRIQEKEVWGHEEDEALKKDKSFQDTKSDEKSDKQEDHMNKVESNLHVATSNEMARTKEALEPIQEKEAWGHEEDEALKKDKSFQETKSDGKRDKQEDHMKKVESNLHVAASNEMARTKEALEPIQEKEAWGHEEDEALKKDKSFQDTKSDGKRDKQEDHMKKVESNLHLAASNEMARTKEALEPIQEKEAWGHEEDEALKKDKSFQDTKSDEKSDKQEDHMKKVESNLHVAASNEMARTKEALEPIQEKEAWGHEKDEALKKDKSFQDAKSDGKSDKQEDHVKKVKSNLHVAASNQTAHVIPPKTDSDMQNSHISMEFEHENNQPSASQMNSMWQQMGQSKISQQESMKPNDKLHESHTHKEHDQDFISFMKASDEHNRRFHSTNQNIHHEMPQERYAEMANAEWDIQNRWQKLRSSGGAYGPNVGYGIPPLYSGSTSSGSATTSGDSSSGAVAVFPNAKAGNCGIPLLLSCSPSVVYGTMSKASSYSAPAYRVKKETTRIVN